MVKAIMSEDEFPSLCGKFLIAMPGMADARFEKSVIYICAHSKEGAMGFVVNRTMDEPGIPDFLQQLEIIDPEEVSALPELLFVTPMHVGGPVEPGRGFVLHSADYESESTVPIRENICLTATLEILREIAIGTGPKKSIMCLGYSGWSSGQLENEILANGWLTADGDEEILFDTPIRDKYRKALALLGVDEALLSADAGHA